MDAENDEANHNQAVDIEVDDDDDVFPVAVEMEDINVVNADNNVNDEANQAVDIQVDDAIIPFAVEGGNDGFVADDADDVIVEGNENAADAVGAENAGEANEAGGTEGIGVGGPTNWQQFCENKSIMWDLEAPSLGYHFEKLAFAESDRYKKIESHIDAFEELMEYVTNVDIMSHLSNEEAQARVMERLELFQQRKIEYQEIKERLQGESNDFRKCVAHLEVEWNKGRLDRALVNHLLRMRYIDTAYNFALKRGIQDLFDFKKFHEADLIVKALQNKDLHPAKAWCNTNARWSNLGTEIFCQEYIELVRTNQNMNAIEFAWNNQDMLLKIDQRVRQVLAAVAFGRDTPVHRYKKQFDEDRWDYLIKLFWEHFIRKQWFTDDASSLCLLLESGITALKVPFCYDGEDCKKVDPLQHEPFRTFASSLPHARHSFPPKLLCHVTKQRMGDHNPPYMLPNGYAYSQQAILGMINGEEVTYPRTGFVCSISDLRILRLRGYTPTTN